MIQVTKTALYI